MNSLRLRLLVSVGVLLLVYLGVVAAVLATALGEEALEVRLEVRLFSLLADARSGADNTLEFLERFDDSGYSSPGSGLYAAVFDREGNAVWESESTRGFVIPWVKSVSIGGRNVSELTIDNAHSALSLSMGVAWEFDDGTTRPYTFHVAESIDRYTEQIGAFRETLLRWFAGVGAALVLSLGLLLGWLLRPLSQIEDEIAEVEQGDRETLSDGYPAELAGVASNLNALVGRERSRGEVYRRTLGDLAHSLKTPLATLKMLLSGDARADVDRELARMDETIRYQLAKPATRGRLIGTRPFVVHEKTEALLASFAKIYAEKAVVVTARVPADLTFRGDTGDFMELAGNVLDNAFKRAHSAVWLTCARDDDEFVLDVSDDGPGFPDEVLAEQRIERGRRLDEAASSQGLGLAIVAEICELYGATLTLSARDGGGARVVIRVPNP